MTPDTLRTMVGQVLRAARGTAGLSLADLASRCGARRPQIVQWEYGRVLPRQERLSRVLAACGAAVPAEITDGYATLDPGRVADQVSAETRTRRWIDFVRAWQAAASVADVAVEMHISAVTATSRASLARRRGVPLKRMRRQRHTVDWQAVAAAITGPDGQP